MRVGTSGAATKVAELTKSGIAHASGPFSKHKVAGSGVDGCSKVMHDKYTSRSRRFGFFTMSTTEEANATIESLNDNEVGSNKIKVNVTENFLPNIDQSAPEPEPVFVDSQYKVYVGNLAKSVTTKMLKNFSEKGEVLSATVSRIPGTS
ncbi:hypothetical protein GUJ93_ZPchr0012g21024 [Zizania palustris]|uniref:RRM domain-containing protein n=1 Tax=Zizania palustris TaxID=103762 RepID=A0A8J5WP59_ZIZPA|nr:hypothetical protein GUJ93_ZPchr0012g21024 [Zizania palustris]